MSTSARTFKDYSFGDHADVYRIIEQVCSEFHIHYYLIGANARDVALYKAGETPTEWQKEESKSMLRQKDVDARWTKKNKQSYYGYKSHINADARHKLIQSYKVTTASVHDSQVFEELLDHEIDPETGKKRAVSADSAYRSEEKEAMLVTVNIESRIS